MKRLAALCLIPALLTGPARSQTPSSPPLSALPALDLVSYTGTWYQVLWIPNRFQRQCVSDTIATYRDLGNGTVAVDNRCRQADGTIDRVLGVARPAGGARIDSGRLSPAQLQVSFLPAWLRWTGLGWGDYWVIALGPQGRYSIVSEPSREYLWVLSRQPALTPEDERQVRTQLQSAGFDLAPVRAHPHGGR